MGENNLDKFRFSRCINFGARDGVVVGRPTEGYHVHMALVGKEALEEWGEWFELEIGKRARYEVYEEMLRVSQLGPDARSPDPLFTSRSRRRAVHRPIRSNLRYI